MISKDPRLITELQPWVWSPAACGPREGEASVQRKHPPDSWTTSTKTTMQGGLKISMTNGLIIFNYFNHIHHRPSSSAVPNLSVTGRSYSTTDLNKFVHPCRHMISIFLWYLTNSYSEFWENQQSEQILWPPEHLQQPAQLRPRGGCRRSPPQLQLRLPEILSCRPQQQQQLGLEADVQQSDQGEEQRGQHQQTLQQQVDLYFIIITETKSLSRNKK